MIPRGLPRGESIEGLFKNKASTGRKKDEANLEELRKFMK